MFEALKNATKQEKMRFMAALLKTADADEALKAGDSAAGIALYREAIDLCPPCEARGDYQVILGRHLFDQGESAAAEEVFRAALAGGCGYPHEALRRLAFACAAQGDFDAAVAAMHRAAKAGEDLAFASQAIVTFGVALGRIEEALQVAEDGPELMDCEPEYRRRLALAAAELARLTGDAAKMRTALDAAAAFRADDGSVMGMDEALRLGVLDHVAGRVDQRREVSAALEEAPQSWVMLAWESLHKRAQAVELVSRLESEPWGIRAENLAQYHRLAGLLAEHEGDLTSARKHYEKARIEPFTQWCIDYHLAGIGLERLGAA